jgi:NAD(P)-dependent dehydrogenase (short-subunit alcohol dehydrogenase family)
VGSAGVGSFVHAYAQRNLWAGGRSAPVSGYPISRMTNLFDLSGRTALVTGGSKGLGKCMARAFAEAGAGVFICSRSEDELKAAAAEIGEGLTARVEYMTADLSDPAQAQKLGEEALARLGRVDVLVNNAGSNIPQAIEEITDDAWDRIIELNLSSAMRLTRMLVPQMKSRQWGRIIHISSVLGLGGMAGRSVYCSTKSALLGLARASAIDLGPFGITVNCIAPGPFLTDLPGRLLTEEQKRRFAERTALGRWGRPEEIVGAALLLASEAGSYITGSTLLVDGGVVARL